MQNALCHLKNDVLPKNPRTFAVMAEGPLAEIEKLRDEIEEKTRETEPLVTLRSFGSEANPVVPAMGA